MKVYRVAYRRRDWSRNGFKYRPFLTRSEAEAFAYRLLHGSDAEKWSPIVGLVIEEADRTEWREAE